MQEKNVVLVRQIAIESNDYCSTQCQFYNNKCCKLFGQLVNDPQGFMRDPKCYTIEELYVLITKYNNRF